MAISPGGRPADDTPVGTPGGRQNWVDKVGGLPKYIRMVAHALIRKGATESSAIAQAVAAIKRMAAGVGPSGHGHVTAKVQAAAAASLAEWEAKKGASHSLSVVEPAAVHGKLAKHYPDRVLGWVKGATWSRQHVPLDSIRMAARPGEPHDPAKVKAIRKAIRKGKKMPPVMLVDTGAGKLRIADGYHRTRALQREGLTHADAIVAKVRRKAGPWDRAMHDAKTN